MNIIVASNNKNVIGRSNKIPWHCPEDLRYFKKMTDGSIVVMGRKTWESLSKPLPNRINVVLSTSMKEHDGIIVMRSVEEVIKFTANRPEKVFIIGGQKVYEQFISKIDTIYLTKINNDDEGDAYFNESLLDGFTLEKTNIYDNSRCLYLTYHRCNYIHPLFFV